jgi:hypothetical protein
MTYLEVLQTAVQKALAAGWAPTQFQAADIPYIDKTWRNIVYTRDFAQKLWGENLYRRYDLAADEADKSCTYTPKEVKEQGSDGVDSSRFVPVWEYNLQQMVIDRDPIMYLKENMPA